MTCSVLADSVSSKSRAKRVLLAMAAVTIRAMGSLRFGEGIRLLWLNYNCWAFCLSEGSISVRFSGPVIVVGSSIQAAEVSADRSRRRSD